jgi:hypothetical protein
MTVYSTTIQTSPTNFNGEQTSSIISERINDHTGSTFASSEDFVDKGVQVIDGKTGDRKSVYMADDLDPSDIVNVQGIPMTVAQAKAAGYSFDGDEPIPVESSANASLTDNEDQATELDLREEGAGTDAEIVALDNVVTAAQMHTGLDEEATVELGTDILTGELKADDPIWNDLQQRGVSRDAAHGAISQVVQVGQQAALRELGAAGYNELSQLADNSPAIKAVVIKHGIARMQGRTEKVTWKHVLTMARQFARG